MLGQLGNSPKRLSVGAYSFDDTLYRLVVTAQALSCRRLECITFALQPGVVSKCCYTVLVLTLVLKYIQ